MKPNSATKLALFLSLIVSLLAMAFIHFLEIDTSNVFFTLAIFFVLAFGLIKLTLQLFISKQIKKIYELLYEGKKVDIKTRSLNHVEQDVLNSQKEKQKNILNLEKQNNYRKEFIGNLSHELKTPLFSIQGYVETLIEGGIHDDQINMAYLKKASDNIDRLSAIVQDVDTIASVESDAMNLDFSSFNIYNLVEECIDSLELLADRNDVIVSLENTNKSLKVFADKAKISRVLINLISNSIKYGKEEGETIVRVKKVADKVLIEIEDNGIGIKKEQLPRIFERFYRVDNNRSREQGGSGLGLAIVKHIIEAHQQSIQVNSIYGEGTSISFTLAIN